MIAGKFPLVAVVALVGLILAAIVAITSSRDHPPKYHKVFHTTFGSIIYNIISQQKTCLNNFEESKA